MKPRILQVGALLPALEQTLNERYDVLPLWREADPAAYLAAHGAEFVGVATSARYGADTALINALPKLKVISSFGVGFETIDIDLARERGIPVGYTPDVLNDCVADTAFGLVMDVARQFSAADRFVRHGDWLKGTYPLATKISGKRMGIMGLGRIGRVIAKRASGFDMEVRYHNRKPVADVDYAYVDSLKGLAEWADFLVIASAGGAETRGLVSREILDALGPDGLLVNVSRGQVLDEAAVIAALKSGTLGQAALDVFTHEPVDPADWAGVPNTVLTPHTAGATTEAVQGMLMLLLRNLAAVFAGEPLVTPVPE